MQRIVIGVDPHKLSATIEVVDDKETVLTSGRFGADRAGYAAMRKQRGGLAEQDVGGGGQQKGWQAVGAASAGRRRAVVDVPAKLAARARPLDTGHGRKTDAHDAHSVAVVAVRGKELRVLVLDPELEALRMLVDRREELARQRTQTANRLQHLFAELTPGKGEEGHHHRAGGGDPVLGASARPGWEDPPSPRRRPVGRAGCESRSASSR